MFSKFIIIKKLDKAVSSNIKKANLGCEMHCLSGWLKIDGSLTSILGTNIDVINKLLFTVAGSSEYYDFSHYTNC